MVTRWVISRPWRVLTGAALLAAVLGLWLMGARPQFSGGGYLATGTEAARADAVLAERFHAGLPDLVLRADARSPVTDEAVTRAGLGLTAALARQPGVERVYSYWNTGAAELLGADRRAALLVVDLAGDDAATARAAEHLVPRFTGRHGPLRVSATGTAYVSAQATAVSRHELLRAEMVGVPLTALALLLAFGSPVAALLPVLTGLFAVLGAYPLLCALATAMPVSALATNLVTALGFGVAVDYGLFLVSRYRQELAATGGDAREATLRTMRTAGRTVFFSSGTIALCLTPMLLFPVPFLRSLACAGIAVVLCSGLVTALLLPALLMLLGRWIDRGDPFARWRRERSAESALWRRVARVATARPLLTGGCCVLLLAASALPFTHVRFGVTDYRVLPPELESHAVAAGIGRDFALPWDRAVTVLLPATDAVEQEAEVTDYALRLSARPDVSRVVTGLGAYAHGREVAGPTPGSLLQITDGGTWLAVTGTGPPSQDPALVRTLRALPAPGPHLVTGSPARVLDTKSALAHSLPFIGALLIGCVLVLLFLFTGSLIVPLKAVALAALSLSASFGAMVYVFQEGHLRWLLGPFTVTGELETSMPVVMFCFAFGLSVDYELFLIARIQEEYRAGAGCRDAVVGGIARTGRVITTASVLVAIAVLPLLTSHVVLLKMFGCGIALAVLMDATVVRGVLVPAFMRLAGRANWWAPAPLPRLHRRLGLHTAFLPSAPAGAVPAQQKQTVRKKIRT
ncbi:MMPL family transporter [Streptomyces griseocarneus]|uniref:MMPL family transporter n=1 Tax=Streptomyces griseocarneus TaxID=51201 RepID=UPI00167DDD74|nr:MMPL family transporter [Streptomyces griseocarneus]MBZ6474339.1 MMPL family transporter [Streptomyces griseocarneus]GHG53399.1 membrane protein [Streptomyces griseocarneus]